jgi:hydroxymethylglutaryl-CoA lyase
MVDVSEESVILEDQALRDGLQMEKQIFSLEDKIKIFNLLFEAGLKRIQVGSFVNPKLVPQMTDVDQLFRKLIPTSGVLLNGLVLNGKGLERAVDSGLTHVNLAVSASDTHSQKNVKTSAKQALDTMEQLISRAKQLRLKVRAAVMCAFGCIYEGKIPENKVLAMVEVMAKAGADGISLADTTGMGNPLQVRQLVQRVQEAFPDCTLSLHLHDTRGLGLANMLAGYEAGVRAFDVAVGGLGGCPFIHDAGGNVPTEDAVNMFEAIGVRTGIEIQKVCLVVDLLESLLGRQLPGRMNRILKANISEK